MGETPSASSAQPFRIKHTITLQSLLLSRSGRFIGVIRISVIAFFTPTSPILEQDAITLNLYNLQIRQHPADTLPFPRIIDHWTAVARQLSKPANSVTRYV